MFYGLAIISLILYLIFFFRNEHAIGGWCGAFFFVFLSIAFRGNKFLKGLSFTVIIFAAVVMALYHPGYFQQWGGFKLSNLIIPLIQIIMFGMGTSMSLRDFAGIVKTPKGVVIGVLSQFIIMPSMGFLLASVTNFRPEVAAGIVLIGRWLSEPCRQRIEL